MNKILFKTCIKANLPTIRMYASQYQIFLNWCLHDYHYFLLQVHEYHYHDDISRDPIVGFCTQI